MRHPWPVVALLPGALYAVPWDFAPPIDVTEVQGSGIYHHLESSGRRNLAIAGDRVAVAWEDERDGMPRVYVAFKRLDTGTFASWTPQVSGADESYEPTILGLSSGRFALAWEEAGRVLVRLLDLSAAGDAQFGPFLPLGRGSGGQPSLGTDGDRLFIVWSEQGDGARQIRYAALVPGADLTLTVASVCAVEAEPPAADQLYPTLAVASGAVVVVAWEDRRLGHTVIMASRSVPDTPCAFTKPQRLSEAPPGPAAPYGKGHGVSRVALAAYGAGEVLAAWADKRDFRHGYDVYGARLNVDGRFGPNFRIQDPFGELSQQWHVALAGHPDGRLAVAWDDNREGHPDLFLSWPEPEGWSDDLPVPGASGPGLQHHPTIAFDDAGRLHLAWVERLEAGGATRLRYAIGVPTAD